MTQNGNSMQQSSDKEKQALAVVQQAIEDLKQLGYQLHVAPTIDQKLFQTAMNILRTSFEGGLELREIVTDDNNVHA